MKFDFKITTWETVTVAEKYEKEVIFSISIKDAGDEPD